MDGSLQRSHSTESTDNDEEYETPEEFDGKEESDDGSDVYVDADGVSMLELENEAKEIRRDNTETVELRQATQLPDKKTVPEAFQPDLNSEVLYRVLNSLQPTDIEPPPNFATRNAYYQNDSWICVTFHALIAPNIKFNSDTDRVYIYFWSEPEQFLGALETKFVSYRSDANNAAEVVGSANFKMQSYYGVVSYKYHVERKGKTSKGKLRKPIEEEVYNKWRQDRRQLFFDYKKNDIKGSFSQYDGFVYRSDKRSKETAWSALGTLFKGFLHGKTKDEDAEIVLKIFGKNIANALACQGLSSKAIADAVLNTNSLIRCVERNYEIRDRKWINTIMKNMYTHVLQTYVNCKDASSGQRKLAISILLLKLRYKFGNFSNDPSCTLLCKSFVPAFDQNQGIPTEWEFLTKAEISTEDRLELKAKLVTLAKDICRGTDNAKNPTWIYLVPLLHFLEAMCKRDEEMSLNCNHSATVPTWWGLTESLVQIVNLFKLRVGTHWTMPLTAVIDDLQELFKMDFYLPRTIMACLLFQETKDAIDTHLLPPEVCCASITYHLKYRLRNEEPQLDKCLESLLNQIEDSRMEMKSRQILVGIQIAVDMLYEALKKEHLGIVSKSVGILLWLLAVNDTLTEGCQVPKEPDGINIDLEAISNKIGEWIHNKMFARTTIPVYIKTWDNFFPPSNIQKTSQIRRWTELVTNLFTHQIQYNIKVHKHKFSKVLVQTYCSELEGCSQFLHDVLTPIVCDALMDPTTITSKDVSDQEYKALHKVMALAFVKECDMITQTHGNFGLDTILRWSSLPMFLKVLYTNKDIVQLNKECQDQVKQIELSVDLYIRILQTGSIKVTELRLLHDNSDKFLSLTELMQKGKNVKEMLETRMLELTSFQEKKSALLTLKTMCDGMIDVTVDTSPIDEILEKDLNSCLLNDLVVISDGSADRQSSRAFRLVSEELTEPVFGILSQIGNFDDSVCFRNQWKEEAQKLETGCTISLDDLICNIYKPVVERLQDFEKGLCNGTVTFNDLEQFIGQYYEDNCEQMICELSKVCSSTNVKLVKRRVEQYKQGRDVIAIAETAREIMDIQTIYGLTGDFQPIEKICSFDIRSIPLSSDKGDIIKASKALGSFSKKARSCLKMFAKCYELVNWLRDSMTHDGLRELKVFVDLAMMSAGDSTEKISRVQSLHAGVTGYSSLIFDLQQKSSYEQFLRKCEPVFIELENTPLLPEKLEHANRFLHWFKEIKQAHGAVEVTSFVQAEVINERGIYKIGTQIWKQCEDTNFNIFHSTIAELTEIKQILKLTVLVDQKHEVPKEYTYDKLQDLQSRLMLVASEAENSKKNVERFSLVLEGVVRLCNIYMKLVKSGCMLFQDFAIKLYCDTNPDRPVCAILEFENENIQLKCRKTRDEQLEDVMHKIASAMDRYLREWLDYVDMNRKKYPELNYFTIEQLVILKREIAKLNDNKEPTHLMYPILHVVKRDCKPEDVKNAHQVATQELETHIENDNNEIEEEEEQEISSNKTVFIQTLSDAGYGRLIQFALQEFPELNASEALCWCMENEDNVEQMEASQRKTTIEEVESDLFARESGKDLESIDTLILRAIDDTSQFDRCEAMLLKLNEIWNDFLKSISTNMKGFISLNHLGRLLRHLSCNDKSTIRRSLPLGFSDCSPNLLVCQKDDILYQTLSLYLTDDDQPLPQADEILTCSAETTFEQVDIFLRRAFFHEEGKIHCLMNADLMSLTVCEAVEQRLQQFQRVSGKNVKYRLVIICDSESENKSVIISSLDRYRKASSLTNQDKLCSLLCSRLRMAENRESAAIVDFEKSTVRVITSTRSGAGKTLYKIRRDEQLQKLTDSIESKSISLPLQEKCINLNYVTGHLLLYVQEPYNTEGRIFHIDITNEVKVGVDYFLFNLLILGCLVDKSGYVWRKLPSDLYLIERMGLDHATECQILHLLPQVICRTPRECLDIYCGHKPEGFSLSDQLFDEQEYNSDMCQKSYSCLKSIDGITTAESSTRHCIETLTKHCGVSNPSWSEIHHFVKFLYRQLLDFEKNVFFSAAAQEILPGFSMFVQRFLIPMSRDFSSRSLNISEESDEHKQDDGTKELHKYKMKRTWESSPHPYLFFNEDGQTFTFLGFNITRSFDLVDVKTKDILERAIMSSDLYQALIANKVPIQEDFDKLLRKQKIERLCKVMGIDEYDEAVYDKTYELTTDNCKKMMAVYMRFRCGIPVIVMGETGCGKTRLVKFLCELMVPRDEKTCKPKVRNMIIMKVHGGVTNEDIKSKVKEAEIIALENRKINENMYTVLFFDEANTTESIGLIKEIMCDQTMEGRPLDICKNLKFVAACNPYRKHPDDLIKKLDKAGLGYHVSSTKTKDTFGTLPMRHLVYRVQPLPQSLMAFVWDFGQLDSFVENLYIRQMVRRYMTDGAMSSSIARNHERLRYDERLLDVISTILTASQDYMRSLKDECSFVSLRDVERTLQVMCWFYSRSKGKRTMFTLADKKMKERRKKDLLTLSDETRSLILALGVCYHASLTNRAAYREHISKYFKAPCELPSGPTYFLEEIDCFEEVFLDSLKLEENIARNQALKENVFMMVVCIELRIPLFLVGKPGSSKSLAKIIVTDAMQGRAAKSALFKELKQVQMISFQCSPHSTAAGIVSTFRQCANFQENYHESLDKFVSVVVLDEIGLAEDSPKMPLKTLHPLLEDGCQGDDTPQEYMKVAFIGLSNWSLDPAKMNRGLFVQREVPDAQELQTTAKGICSSIKFMNNSLITPLATAYLKVFNKASEEKREFFGLRDFYSFMKMINNFVKNSRGHHRPTYHKLRFAVRRNFSGIENFDTFKIFLQEVKYIDQSNKKRKPGDPDDSFSGLIKNWLLDECESRHLLLLTENYSAISMFEQQFLTKAAIKPIIIFGSSFRRDQEYTQVCRNINRIKLCMETGNLVILVNSDNLYESLYDALNQYYVYFGGERYVDLGLGTHRVKCPVHLNFKLIVVAEKETVYKKFPIPLINRLEKHCLSSSTLLSEGQTCLATQLKEWLEKITMESLSLRNKAVTENDVKKIFIGYHQDACSAVAHHMMTDEQAFRNEDMFDELYTESKELLLWCATPDAIVRLTSDKERIQDIYLHKQAHDSITDYLQFQFKSRKCNRIYAQITTHSTLLTMSHIQALGEATGIPSNRILLLEALSSYDTEQQFNSKIKEHVRNCGNEPSLLVIQCHSGDMYVNLIACAKYSVLDECASHSAVSLLFIIQLTPMETKCFQSLQCGEWHSAHIDNLYSSMVDMPRLLSMEGTPLSSLLNNALDNTEIATGRHIDERVDIVKRDQKEMSLDLKGLIYRCVQRAMSLVRDSEDDAYRSTKRISWVLSILHDNTETDSVSFVKGITVFVKNILAIRESFAQRQDEWFAKEAASSASIQKFGTLRRACLQSVESKISPILSGIFAELDSNQNLGILDKDTDSWQRILWLSLLNTHEVREHMKSIKCENTENVVIGRGFGGRTFQNKMPFSWIILQTFEHLVRQQTIMFGENDEEGLNPLVGLLEGTGLRKSIDSVAKESFYEALEAYINDFTETVYPEEKDRHLVSLYLKHYALTMAVADQKTCLTYTLFCVHRVFENSSACLKYFRDISSVWEGCSDTLFKRKGVDLLEEHDLALLALYYIVDSVSPESKQLEETFDYQAGREKWLGRVNRYRQVVNQTFTFYQTLGDQSERLGKAKNMWNRVVVMQLFIENVCLKSEDQSSIFRCRPLWMQLSTIPEVNMKHIDTLQKVEKFLQMCLTRMKNESIKKAEKCKKCGGTHNNKSKTLSCTHEICENCIEEVLTESESGQKCPICKKELEDGWNLRDNDEETVKRWIADKLGDYRQRCNSFLMELVSQLCFADNTPPDPKVVDWLISCSFQNDTKIKADIGVEQNAVFKSFIFKHLVRTDEKELRVHLEKYIQTPVEGNKDASEVPCEDVILTVIHSFEDKIAESMTLRNANEEIIVERCFNLALISIESKESVVDQIFAIARARVGLSVTAKYIDKLLFHEDSVTVDSKKYMEEMLQLAKELCEDREWPWKYLLLYITREYGVDALLSACKSLNTNINWMQKKALQEKVHDTVDIYTACGNKYITMKQFILTTLMSKDENDLVEYIKKSTNNKHLVVMFELAVHREIEIPRAIKGKDKTEQQLAVFKQAFLAFQSPPGELNAIPLALNQIAIKQLQLDVCPQKDNDRDINIKCLIFHWLCVIRHLESNCCAILKPLFQIAVEPETAKNYYLPCMPHDILAGLRATLMETAKEKYSGQNTVYFQCENGHPYEVGNCGRPVATGAKCFCGSPIGGTAYNVLHEKNRPVDNTDRTLPGHCLGVPQTRDQGAIPERSLSPIQCALLKFLLHITMYLGSGKNTKGICSLIKPEVEEKLVHKFLWDHILLDIQDLQGALTLNTDEVLLLVHCCVDGIMEKGLNKEGTQGAVLDTQCTLATKEGRDKWEGQFADLFFKDVVDTEGRKGILIKAKELLQNSNSLLAMLNECTDEFQGQISQDMHNLDKSPNVWKYRTPVSLTRLGQAFQRKMLEDAKRQHTYPVLEIFLNKQSEIQAVSFVPSILQLHKALLRRYSRKIFKSEAQKMTVAQLRKDKIAGEDTEALLGDLIEAWNVTRKILNNSIVRTEKGTRIVSQEMSTDVSTMDITDDTALVYLLPTMEGKGICTYALLDHLIQCHNDVIERYKYSDRGQRDTGFSTVQPKDITSAHVISYHPQDDLLPIVMANCLVSTKHSTEDVYDFEKIEKRIVERFISTKSRVVKKGFLQIELMTYRSSLTHASKLEHLRRKIIQEPFETAVKTTLCNEIRDVPVISQILSKLDIAINFLDITGGDPDDSLHDFMTDRLKMTKNVLTAKMQQACSLKHVRALWLALSLHRSNIMVQQNKPTEMIFENIEPVYHDQVPAEIKQTYTKYLQVLPKELLFQIMEVVYEFITVILTETENKEDEDYVDRGHFSLVECLAVFAEDINVPEDILCIHALHFWVEVSRMYDIRIKERTTAV